MGSLTCFSMRFDDKTSAPRLTPRFAWRRSITPRRVRTNVSAHSDVDLSKSRSTPDLTHEFIRCSRSIGAFRRRNKRHLQKVVQLALMKRTPVALPRISAGVSKNKHQIWRPVGTSTGVRCDLPSFFLRTLRDLFVNRKIAARRRESLAGRRKSSRSRCGHFAP